MPTLTINAVLIEREPGQWVAQCLEHDIGAQAPTLQDLVKNLHRALIGHIAICEANGVKPFFSLEPAPTEYWNLWRRARYSLVPDIDPEASNEKAPEKATPLTTAAPQTKFRVAYLEKAA